MKVLTVVGARPQFIKVAAVSHAIEKAAGRVTEVIVHTGQHFDANMSAVFFEELAIPEPKYNLGISGGTHGEMTGRMLAPVEKVILDERPDLVMIHGDTNSTLAASLAAVKIHVPIGHVEAGLRSYNRRIPEEVNRVVADHLSNLLFCPTPVAVENLAKEGIVKGVFMTGDVMYDSAIHYRRVAEQRSDAMKRLGLAKGEFYLATIHRPDNASDVDRLRGLLDVLDEAPRPVVLPVHPRTRKTLEEGGLKPKRIRMTEPASYLDMLLLENNARVIVTDSGGVQKEAYFAGVPCITLRPETEWVELVEAGWNRLVGHDAAAIRRAIEWAETMDRSSGGRSLYGDGHAAERIVAILLEPRGG